MAATRRKKKTARSRLGRAMAKAKRTATRRKARARVPRRITRIVYVRTKQKRVRYHAGDQWSKQSYASRQGARRAAKRQFKGTRVIAVPAKQAAA